jgi:hypothetical protein
MITTFDNEFGSGYGASIARLVIFVQSSNNSLSTALPDIQSKYSAAT